MKFSPIVYIIVFYLQSNLNISTVFELFIGIKHLNRQLMLIKNYLLYRNAYLNSNNIIVLI